MPSPVVHQLGGRGRAEADQEIGIGQLDLARDERAAGGRLLRRRRAVAGRPPGHDVGDVDLRPVEADRGEHAVEQLAGAADERQRPGCPRRGRAPRRRTSRGLRVAVGEDQLGRGEAEIAALEASSAARSSSRVAAAAAAVRGALDLRRRARPVAGPTATRGRAGEGSGVRGQRRGAVAVLACGRAGERQASRRSTGASSSATSTPISAYQARRSARASVVVQSLNGAVTLRGRVWNAG